MKHTKLASSLLFVAVCSEENSLLGSRYFAEHATVTDEPMVTDINLDMFMPLFLLERLSAYGLKESTPMNQTEQDARDYSLIDKVLGPLLFGFGYAPGQRKRQLQKGGCISDITARQMMQTSRSI